MAITRLSIVVNDTVNNTGTIIINDVGHENCDLSFLGTYPCSECEMDVAARAVQWDSSVPKCEIELVTTGMNIESETLDATLAAGAQASLDARVAAIAAEAAAAAAAAAAEDDEYFDSLLAELSDA